MRTLRLPYRRALVVGLGRSGLAAVRLLLAAGVEVRGYDRRGDATAPPEVDLHTGEVEPRDEAFADLDLVVLSPGVDPQPWRERAARLAPEATIEGELSLALRLAEAKRPTVLITGTNGKSTVTAMTGALLTAAGHEVFVGGNLGEPPSEALLAVARGERPTPDMLVLECSSYQLETLVDHPTAVAMILNVTPDHLDRYPTMEVYADTKSRVFQGLVQGGLALLDARDPHTPRLRAAVPSRAECVEVDGPEPPRISGDALEFADHRIARSHLRVAGRHNAKNALFAALAASALGVDTETITRGLAAYEALPHRMNLVAEIGGIAYYDDSKATNVASVLASLDGFERPFVLIAGGEAKGDELAPLGALLVRSARGLVAIGRDAAQFLALAHELPVARAETMDQAIELARAMARPGDAIVLSPACASFDMFTDYAHRGRMFCDAVLRR